MALRSRAWFFASLLLAAVAAGSCQLLAEAGVPLDGLPGASPAPSGAVGGTTDGGVAGSLGEPGSDDPFLPGADDAAPKPVATYHNGRATVVFADGSQLVLDRINRGPHLYAQFGSLVRWSNDGGWYMTISGAGAEADMGAPFLIFDRVSGTEHWTTVDPAACNVHVDGATPALLAGTVSCRGLRWVDALDTGINGDHPLILSQPPFSATVTFGAAP